MTFSNRILLKHYLIDVLLIAFSSACFFLITILIGELTQTMGKSTPLTWIYFWSGMCLLALLPYTIVFLWNVVLKNIQYHRNVAKSKLGSSLKRYFAKPKESQALDVLKDVLFALDWMSFNGVNDYLSSLHDDLRIWLDDQTDQLRDQVLRPAPEIYLMHGEHVVAKLPIYK